MWVDCHCHLDQMAESAVREAMEAGVHKICAVSESLESMKSILKLKEQYPSQVVVGLGLHPQHFDSFSDDVISNSIDFISSKRDVISMIGEIGIDYKYATTDEQKERQLILLNKQLDLAEKLKLPLNVHSRRAERNMMRLGLGYKQKTHNNVVLHWFTHDRKLVRQACKGGLFVSVGPDIYDAKTKAVVKEIDIKCMLLESDGPVEHPDLAHLGTIAAPKWIPKIGASVAELFSISESHLQDILLNNFERFVNNQ